MSFMEDNRTWLNDNKIDRVNNIPFLMAKTWQNDNDKGFVFCVYITAWPTTGYERKLCM